MNGLKIAIILGSTRPGRNGKAVAEALHDDAAETLFGQLETWAGAMKSIRSSAYEAAR